MHWLLLLGLGSALAGGAAIWLWVRARKRPPAPAPPVAAAAGPRLVDSGRALGCPTCRREFPAGVRFCSYDARALIPIAELEGASAGSVTCRTCRRSFDPGTRFCPFDAEDLGPMMTGLPPPPLEASGPVALRRSAKICPSCGQRYATDESFCGRDGAELVTLN